MSHKNLRQVFWDLLKNDKQTNPWRTGKYIPWVKYIATAAVFLPPLVRWEVKRQSALLLLLLLLAWMTKYFEYFYQPHIFGDFKFQLPTDGSMDRICSCSGCKSNHCAPKTRFVYDVKEANTRKTKRKRIAIKLLRIGKTQDSRLQRCTKDNPTVKQFSTSISLCVVRIFLI